MRLKSGFHIVREADVTLSRKSEALEEIDVFHVSQIPVFRNEAREEPFSFAEATEDNLRKVLRLACQPKRERRLVEGRGVEPPTPTLRT